jgi:membrane protein implicated in regulation of membrane protease activity
MAEKKAGRMKKAGPAKEAFGGKDIAWERTGGKIPYLETSIDKFYHLIKKKGSMNFYDAAAEYGVDKEQIASWARILEEHKLAKVHYPVFGSPVILVGGEEPKKGGKKEGEAEPDRKSSGKRPLIIIALAAGLMVLIGYVMVASNPYTIAVRTQITAAAQRIPLLFWFLPYPLNIITPVAIIIATLLLVWRMRRKGRPPKRWPKSEEEKEPDKEEEKQGREKKKEPKERPKKGKSDIEDKLSKIKEELGS